MDFLHTNQCVQIRIYKFIRTKLYKITNLHINSHV
jgi:hypothetical protein